MDRERFVPDEGDVVWLDSTRKAAMNRQGVDLPLF